MRIIAEGILQGVGYRAIVEQAARFLGIQGLVRNLDDGRVEIFSEGPEERIQEFLKTINLKGKPGDLMAINVTKIKRFKEGEKKHNKAWKPYKGFEIDYGIKKLSPFEESTLEDHEFGKLYFSSFRNELKSFGEETNKNFAQMAQKYGDISTELKEFRKGIQRLLTSFLKEYTKKKTQTSNTRKAH